jgi:Putative transmembrane family 234
VVGTQPRIPTAFLLNQSWSFLYYKLLGEYPLALSVSTANSLAFVFTARTEAIFINRSLPESRVLIGSAMIITGIYLCHSSDLSSSCYIITDPRYVFKEYIIESSVVEVGPHRSDVRLPDSPSLHAHALANETQDDYDRGRDKGQRYVIFRD